MPRRKRVEVQPPAQPFGAELAERVAQHLEAGGSVLSGWCAHHLVRTGARFQYEVLKPERREVFGTRSRRAFVAWLQGQSAAALDAEVRPACQDVIEPITAEVLEAAMAEREGIEDPTPYGTDLAKRVAGALRRGARIAFDHRDYCGMGLVYRDRAFRYASISDGQECDAVQSFTTEAAFVTWLAAQSDASLSGRDEPDPFSRGNQRITRARLLAVAGP